MKILGTYRSYKVVFDKTFIDFVVTENVQNTLSSIYNYLRRMRIKMDDFSAVDAEIQEYSGYGNKKLVLNIIISTNDVLSTGIAALVNLNNVAIELFEIDGLTEVVQVDFYNKILLGITNLTKVYNLGNVGETIEMLKQRYGIVEPLSKSMSQFNAEVYYNALTTEADSNGIYLFAGEGAFKYAKFLKERIKENKCAVCDSSLFDYVDGFPLCEKHYNERKNIGKKKFNEKHKFV